MEICALRKLNILSGPGGKGSKTFFRSAHVVEQLTLSIVSSILTFDFDLILKSFLAFLGSNGLFLGLW